MKGRRTNILLELIDDILVKYPDTEEYIQQKLQEKCKREGILIETGDFIFWQVLELERFYRNL